MDDTKTKAIDIMFNPSSIAVIGATEEIERLGGKIIPNIFKVGYKGKIFPVNPNRKEILGFKCYSSIKDISDDVDLACIIVPTSIVLKVVTECAEKKVRVVIIITAGFSETGEEGKKLEDEISQIAKKAGIRICGPNCYGMISTVTNASATFCRTLEASSPKRGEVSIVSQSGAIGAAILSRMWELDLGVSRWISSGNEIDLQVQDYISYLVEDPYTKVIAIFLEGVRNGKEFVNAVQNAARAKKPVIILKIGRSKKGQIAAKSHTGALTGSYEIYKAVFKQTGVIRVSTLEELIEVPMAFAWQHIPRGNGVGVISTSGGICSIAADVCEEEELELPSLTQKTLQKLQEILPPAIKIVNPLDFRGRWSADTVKRSIEIIGDDPKMDMLLVYLGIAGNISLKLAKEIIEACDKLRSLAKPVFITWMAARSHVLEAMQLITENRIPLYSSPEKALKAMSYMVKYSDFLRKNQA